MSDLGTLGSGPEPEAGPTDWATLVPRASLAGVASSKLPLPRKQVRAGTEPRLSQGSRPISGHLLVDLAQCWVEMELHLEVGG